MRFLFPLFLFCWAAPGLAQNAAADSILLDGQITMRPGWRPRLYLVRPAGFRQLLSPFEGQTVDSADVAADGSFRFFRKNWLTEKGLFRLCIQPERSRWPNGIEPIWQENFAVLVLSPTASLRLTGDAWELARSYKIERGDADNQAIAKIRGLRRTLYDLAETDLALAREKRGLQVFDRDIPTMKVEMSAGTDSLGQARLRARVAAENEERRQLKNFMDTTRSLFAGFVALQRLNPLAEYNRDVNYFVKLCYRWSNLPPGALAAWMAEFRERMKRYHPAVMVGDTMPGLAALGAQGDSLRLSDIGGPLRVVYFWFSENAASRKLQKNVLRPLYQEFSAKGLAILGYSIDTDAPTWLAALREDGAAAWPNVRDPRGRRADPLFELDVVEYPTVFVLDAAGTVLARNLSGEDLQSLVRGKLGK